MVPYVRKYRNLFYTLTNMRTYVYIYHGHCHWGRAVLILRYVKKWVFLKLIFIRTYYYVCKNILTFFNIQQKNTLQLTVQAYCAQSWGWSSPMAMAVVVKYDYMYHLCWYIFLWDHFFFLLFLMLSLEVHDGVIKY